MDKVAFSSSTHLRRPTCLYDRSFSKYQFLETRGSIAQRVGVLDRKLLLSSNSTLNRLEDAGEFSDDGSPQALTVRPS